MIKGILIPIGGNEDKGNEEHEENGLDYITEGILSRIVKESGGVNAKIKVITSASRIPVEVGENYTNAFQKLACNNVAILDVRDRETAESSSIIKHFEEADCIMFSGGDQSRIVDIFSNTLAHEILLKRYKNERIVIAGTSAGAMAMSTEMIAGGSSTEALVKGSVEMREGMGLIPKLVIDSHFIQRGRFGRLAASVAKFPDLIGVGLAEDTGLVIKNGNDFTIIGSGMVIVFDPHFLEHNNENILEDGTPMTMSNLKVHVLANGDSYSIKDKKITVLPLESAFE